MKNYLFVILFSISLKTSAQIDWIGNYYIFKELAIYNDPTEFDSYLNRKSKKIKNIKIETIVTNNVLDELGRGDSMNFKAFIRNNETFHYPRVEYFNFSESGIIIDYKNYPISKYITKTDSIHSNYKLYQFKKKGKLEISEYIENGKSISKSYFEKGLLKKTVSNISIKSYKYDSKNNLVERNHNDKTQYYSFYKKDSIIHNLIYFDSTELRDRKYIMKVELDSLGRFKQSITYEVNMTDIVSYEKTKRDLYGNITEIIASYDPLYKDYEEVIKLKNEYKNGVLVSITQFYPWGNSEGWTKYKYQDGLLVEKEYHRGAVKKYSYTFY